MNYRYQCKYEFNIKLVPDNSKFSPINTGKISKTQKPYRVFILYGFWVLLSD